MNPILTLPLEFLVIRDNSKWNNVSSERKRDFMKISFFAQVKRTAKIYKKGFLVSWEGAKAFYQTALLDVTLQTIKPYISLWFSALLLDELLGNRDWNRLIFFASVIVLSECILSLIIHFLNMRWDTENYFFYRAEEFLFLKKLFHMDYADIENIDVRNLYTEVREASHSGENHNLLALRKHIIDVWSCFLDLVISLWMLTGFVTQVSFPLWTWLVIIAIYIICNRFSVKGIAKSEIIWQEYSKNIVPFCRARDALYFYLINYQSGKNLRIYQGEQLAIDNLAHWHTQNDIAIDKQASDKMHTILPFTVLPLFLSTASTQIFIALAALAGSISIGSITKYVTCISNVSRSFLGLANVLTAMRYNADYLKKYFRFLDLPNAMYQGSLPVEKRHDNEFVIEFQHVSFRYPGTDKDVLKDINLTFHVGEKMAIVGMNGSGKTTFIKLLCRLYDPTEGVILLNGIDIRKFDYQEYLSLFSIVFQDFHIFSFPLGENVAANQTVDREQAIDALKKAGLEEFLDKLPNGLDTLLYTDFDKHGIQPSGGEAQKIALARAVYKNAPYVLLDEPTAALDPVAEFEIYSRFQEIVGDKTTVFISHRLSSCRFCKDIAVFHEGQLVQRGSHEELVTQEDGKYYELWNAQAQYYSKENSVHAS